MDESVRRAMQRWPAVPAVFGWLSLNARGEWRIRNPASERFERIERDSIRDFIARNYASDEQGRWYFQNGPQRVYVELEIAPLVYRVSHNEGFVDHCGRPAAPVRRAWMDEQGTLLLETDATIGNVDDRDLEAVSDRLSGEGVEALSRDSAILRPAASVAPPALHLRSGSTRIPVQQIERRALEARFGFARHPAPREEERAPGVNPAQRF